MNRLLIVVDMQNDFIDGSLGTKEAAAILPNVVEKSGNIRKMRTISFLPWTLTLTTTWIPRRENISRPPLYQKNEGLGTASRPSGTHRRTRLSGL